ncbi:Wzz/FepE/Etk N-terminal domain-containing protein [Pontibacter oryzae]|uniref:Chain length determinant protein n=1 Tax=Pontibacter oryzae TaxID=2304593 RepID=A0A399SBN0_9BACT|nr:Wzz/FepE/Etk N-terminal domain-containing protein [Pontibacter oryzae]RIJ41466.1 chain length determinant protein [Pontibacter oryzae]
MYKKLQDEQEERIARYNDEIDLRLVFNRIGNAFERMGNGLKYLLNIAIKRFILILIFTVAGLGLAYAIFATARPYYTSSMTLVLSKIRNDFVETQLQSLSDMINEGNLVGVSEELEITPESAQSLKELSFSNLDDDMIGDDSVLTGSPFKVELSLYQNSLFAAMEPAIVSYLENNSYFMRQKKIREQELRSMIEKLNQEISSIDSLKRAVGDPRGPVNGFVYGEPIDPTNLYKESIAMYEHKVELEAKLNSLDNIQVVGGFTPRSMPTGPSLLKYLLIGGSVCFLFGLIIAVYLESNKNRRLA